MSQVIISIDILSRLCHFISKYFLVKKMLKLRQINSCRTAKISHESQLSGVCFVIGKYVYIETSSPRVQGDNAKLVKSGLSFSTIKCLSFYYHMYGSTMGTLNVYVGNTKIFTKSGNQGNSWHKAAVAIIPDPGASTVRDCFNCQTLVIYAFQLLHCSRMKYFLLY